MNASVRCPQCGSVNQVPAESLGTAVRCSACLATYRAPKPQAAEKPQPAAPGPTRASRLTAFLWVGVFLMLLAIAGTSAALIARILSRRPRTPAPVVEEVVKDAEPAGKAAADASTGRWTPANKALVRDNIRVNVLKLAYGEVRARDERNAPIVAGPGEFLQIYLEIESRCPIQISYVSWYGNKFENDGEAVVAELLAPSEESFPQQRFEGVRGLQGHTPEATLNPQSKIGDVLIFAVPPDKLRSGESLFLELPAGAFLTTTTRGRWIPGGFFRFEIPADMLADL